MARGETAAEKKARLRREAKKRRANDFQKAIKQKTRTRGRKPISVPTRKPGTVGKKLKSKGIKR